MSTLINELSSGPTVRLQTLVQLRWVAVFGQVATILFVAFGLDFELPLISAFNTVLALALFNTVVANTAPRRLSSGQALVHLSFDLIQLGMLLYLTGGLLNPFSVLLLAPIVIGANILHRDSVVVLVIEAAILMAILYNHYQPLPWVGGDFVIDPVYKIGMAAALLVGLLFMAGYSYLVAIENRGRARAHETLQQEVGKARKMAALGALAAATGHELGTPLNSIYLIARDLKSSTKTKKAQKDVVLLLEQVDRCKKILSELSRNPNVPSDLLDDHVGLPALIESMVSPFKKEHQQIAFKLTAPKRKNLKIPQSPELTKALYNLLDNAFRFARKKVTVKITVTPGFHHLIIEDDGPGFDAQVLARLGEPYVGTKQGGMGLGIFVAQSMLEGMGGVLTFANKPAHGAVVEVKLPREG